MSNTWTGLSIVQRLSEKFGDTSPRFKERVLEWINDIMNDFCSDDRAHWGFLKVKLKKLLSEDQSEVFLAPQVPSVPAAVIAAGGAVAPGTYRAKVSFLILGEGGDRYGSIESEPSEASAAMVIANPNQTIALSAIDIFEGDEDRTPLNIYRRIYLSRDGGDYYFAAEISNNVDTTLNIADSPSESLITPVDMPPVLKLAKENPWISGTTQQLTEDGVDRLLSCGAATSSGRPQSFGRLHGDRIVLYPRASADQTIEYYAIKRPRRIFLNQDQIQLPQELRAVLEAGATWKFYEYYDREGQESKKMNYEAEVAKANRRMSVDGGRSARVRDTEGDWQGFER